jgi:hypothetical protein
VAFSSGEQSYGKVETPLAIEAWDGRQLSLSGIALAREAQKAADLSSDLDPSLLEGHKQLVARSLEILPSGANRFPRSGSCFAYFEIYEPLLAASNPPTLGLEIRVFDRKTGEQKQTGTLNAADYIRPGAAVAPVVLSVPMASLPAGPYRLEVKVARSHGDASAIRTVEFEVEE